MTIYKPRALKSKPSPGAVEQRLPPPCSQDMTAHYLACSTRPLGPSDTALVHTAAGGTGRLLVQAARLRGARVIGTVSTEEKETHARQDIRAQPELPAPPRHHAAFGQSSGPVPPIDPQVLNRKGSLFLTRPSLCWYVADRTELLQRARDVFGWMAAGKLALAIDRVFPLAEAARAHDYLESRVEQGKGPPGDVNRVMRARSRLFMQGLSGRCPGRRAPCAQGWPWRTASGETPLSPGLFRACRSRFPRSLRSAVPSWRAGRAAAHRRFPCHSGRGG